MDWKKGGASRDKWIQWMLLSFGPHELEANPSLTSWNGLKNVWRLMSQEARATWCKAARSNSLGNMQRPTLEEVQAIVDAGRNGAEESAKEAGDVKAPRGEFVDKNTGHRGGQLTWHGRWGAEVAEVEQLMTSTADIDSLVDMIRKSEFYNELWKSFKSFIVHLLGKHQWPQISITMEVTKKRKKSHNLVHFHAAFSDHRCYHRNRGTNFYVFAGSKPHWEPLHARGERQADRARSRLHYYIMAPKVGTVFEDANWHRGRDYQVQAESIMNLWRLQKLTHEAAKAELIKCRVQGTERCLREVEVLQREEMQVRLRAEWLEVMQMLPQKPFRVLPEVEAWKVKALELYGKVGRFKFLVLNGPSQVGKTRFAQALFGMRSSLIVSCQNVQVPNLRAYRRYEHKCIIYDEGSSKMVVNNKAIFQSNCDFVGLGQSVCNQHFYEIFLYGTPQVVCCNDWMKDINQQDEEAINWLNANAVVVHVSRKLYVETSQQPPLTDM